jgi:hypothetical protein
MNGVSERGKPVKLCTLVRRLVRAGLWEEDGPNYRIHDFLEYQPSRRQVETRRAQIQEVRTRAGAAGGQQTSSKRAASVQPRPNPSRTDPDPLDYPPSPPEGGNNQKPRRPRRHRPMNDPETAERIREAVKGGKEAWPDLTALMAARREGFDVRRKTQADYEMQGEM